MSTGQLASTNPSVGNTKCGDPSCQDSFCCDSPDVKKPWYMTQKPVVDPANEPSPPIVLMKMDGWVLEKILESDTESCLSQYCPSAQWKKSMSIAEIRAGLCNSCCEVIPEEMVAAYTMHNWTMLQQYDKDMKEYGCDPYDSTTTSADIQVYR